MFSMTILGAAFPGIFDQVQALDFVFNSFGVKALSAIANAASMMSLALAVGFIAFIALKGIAYALTLIVCALESGYRAATKMFANAFLFTVSQSCRCIRLNAGRIEKWAARHRQ